MTREEYEAYANETKGDWAPGWEAIDNSFSKIYPNQEPYHFATNMVARSIFGGDEYLDGYSIYQSKSGYKHIVTYGMSELYANVDAFGGEFSKWGYEMTIKLPAISNEECYWVISMLSNLARYTFMQKRYFEPLQFISGGGKSIKADYDSKITALLAVEDTEVKGCMTLHGKLDFIQLVGITQNELDALVDDIDNAKLLIERMKIDNPFLITQLDRVKSYL